jgi:hypothetical protein
MLLKRFVCTWNDFHNGKFQIRVHLQRPFNTYVELSLSKSRSGTPKKWSRSGNWIWNSTIHWTRSKFEHKKTRFTCRCFHINYYLSHFAWIRIRSLPWPTCSGFLDGDPARRIAFWLNRKIDEEPSVLSLLLTTDEHVLHVMCVQHP